MKLQILRTCSFVTWWGGGTCEAVLVSCYPLLITYYKQQSSLAALQSLYSETRLLCEKKFTTTDDRQSLDHSAHQTDVKTNDQKITAQRALVSTKIYVPHLESRKLNRLSEILTKRSMNLGIRHLLLCRLRLISFHRRRLNAIAMFLWLFD